jgi:glycosyltransferase involved in cell wall biosynthesis
MSRSSILLIEACDFERFPVGGQLTTVRQLLGYFGNRFALVGVTTDDTPAGRWVKRVIDGVEFDFFGIARVDPARRKPLLPRRLTAWLSLLRQRKRIQALGVRAALVVAPEVMLAVSRWGLRIGYLFCGVENPLSNPRYPVGRLLAGAFEARLHRALSEHAELILAAADPEAIQRMRGRSGGKLANHKIVFFPSMYDSRVFRVAAAARRPDEPLLVSCGRLNLAKGWDLVLEAFVHVRAEIPGARLCFVGDGEDRRRLEARIEQFGIGGAVSITGFLPQVEVARILNYASALLLGSHNEGWPTAVVEAEACGLPVVMTRVSGASALVISGNNGYVVGGRDPQVFASRVIESLRLECPNQRSLGIAAQYSVERQMQRLKEHWPLLE